MNVSSCGEFVCYFSVNCELFMEPEVFSLEDDDYGNMFITQESSQYEDLVEKEDKIDNEDGLFLGLSQSDFSSPCVSVLSQG